MVDASLADGDSSRNRACNGIDHRIIAGINRNTACLDDIGAIGGIANDIRVDVGTDLVEDEHTRSADGHSDLTSRDCDRSSQDDGVDFLLHGHTHTVQDERVGRTRVINPGALHRASRYTCALLDPSGKSVRWLEIGKRSPHG